MDIQTQKTQEQKNKKTRVRVAIRVRPMIPREIANNENSCVQFQNNNQVILAREKNYKFDHVFKQNSHQNQIYSACVKDLVLSCFDGYNAAILAYGQTGSGKTYTMGTSINSIGGSQNHQGIIPRVIEEIFHQVKQRQKKAQFIIKASFLEIYNEQILDLLCDSSSKNTKIKDHVISIRQEKDGSVSICNIVEEQVTCSEQMLDLLERGGYHRTTASTMMNDASSRSHAIFTIFIQQHIIEDLYKNDDKKKDKADVEDGFMTAKFFFVDLAGSQRAKKTGATGSTLKEGININLGLLQLGNVISALATIEKKQAQFITFRNSKLTRILQDCLGGNSNTYMIACISPAQSNYQQSLNTLKYASKAMNIKNTPIKNRDPHSALISQLRQKIYELEVQNRKLKGLLNQKGINVEEQINKSPDLMYEQVKKLKKLYVNLQKKYEQSLLQLKEEKRLKSRYQIDLYDMKRDRDIAFLKLESLRQKYPQVNMQQLQDDKNMGVLNQLTQKIQTLTLQLRDKDKLYDQLQHQFQEIQNNSKKDQRLLIAKNNKIYHMKKENEKLKKQIKLIKQQMVMTKSLSQSDISSSAILTQANNSLLEQINQKYQDQEIDQLQYHDYMTPQLQQHQQKFNMNHRQTQNRLNCVDRQISEKQHFLQAMSSNQIKLQYQLISQMKEQYHHKITMLERQKSNLVRQKDQTVGQNDKNKFINKIDNLQTQLKDYRKRAKQQKNLQKLVGNQSEKIKDLANEIKKFKVQKIQLGRKLKEDKDVFHKYKSKKIKQLLKARKQNVKKDNQIKKMVLQNNRKAQTFRKKQEQLKKQKKINDTLKSLIKPKNNRTTKDQHQQININYSHVDQHVVGCIQKMLGQIDQQKTLQKYLNKIKQLQEEIQVLLNQDSTLRLKIQRYKLIQEQQQQFTEQQINQKQQISLNLNDLNERISNAQDNLNFCKNKYNEVLVSNPNIFDLDTQIIYKKNYQSVQALRAFLRSLFPTIRNILFDNYGLYQIKQQLQIEINSKNIAIQQYKQRIIKINSQHQQALQHLRQDMMMRYYSNMQDQQPISTNINMKRMEQRDKKNFQRKILDLTKTNRQISHQAEMWRRKCNVVQQKYQNIRSLLSKDKNIGRQRDQENLPKQKKGIVNKPSLMLDQINQMTSQLDKLDKIRRIPSTNQQVVQKKQETDAYQYTVNKWQCLGKIDAHNSSVLSIAAHANMLISTSTKSLKIWDLQTSKIISDLSGAHLTGLVKYVMVDPQRNIMLTACEKVITIWDLITLNVQCSLKAHKDQVRTMHIVNDVLFTGGKGLANSGSLLIWDLRNLDPNKPQEQKQRNQDIFTFASKENTLYYGTRNHHVRRMDLKNMEILSPFQPPHMDTVTGLAVVGNKLVSGSKDKNLRLWSLDHSISNLKNTTHAFNDYVTTLQSKFKFYEGDNSLSIFYTGSKDGQVKVGSVKHEKIEFVGGILAHSQSVNAINPLQDSNAIVTASADKTIKLWRPSHETVEKIQKQFL